MAKTATKQPNGLWDATCPRNGCDHFTTRGHATEGDAEARMQEHWDEHAEGERLALQAKTDRQAELRAQQAQEQGDQA
jgi:hypothetical protein